MHGVQCMACNAWRAMHGALGPHRVVGMCWARWVHIIMIFGICWVAVIKGTSDINLDSLELFS